MELQEIYNKINSLISLLETNADITESTMLKDTLYSGITSGEILDNLKVCLNKIKKIKTYKTVCKNILRDIRKL